MSLKSKIKAIEWENVHIAYRPPQTYLTAAPGPAYTIFSVVGGAIEALNLMGRNTAAAVGAEQIRITANTVNTDAAAIAINGAVGTIWYSSLNVAGTLINAAAVPRTVATLTTMIVGTQPAGPGLIVATFGVGTSWTGEIYLVYRKLSPFAMVNIG
jgi:hypothetical protein